MPSVRKVSVPEDKNKNDGPLPDERLRTDENGAAHASANGSSPERSEAPLEPPPRETRIDPPVPEPAPAKEESGKSPEASGSGEDSRASAREEARARKAREKEEKKAAAAAAREAQKEAKEAKSKEKREKDKEKDAAAQGEEGEAPRQGRLARLRFSKKKDMPGGLWLKCESCAEVIFRKELEEKDRVCPSCGFHFTVPGRERVRMVLDEGSWNEHYEELESLDRLEFTDSRPYGEKLERAVSRSSQKEALLCGTGEILGRKVALAILDFGFLGGSMGEVVGEKIALAADLARKESCPLILYTASGGARMHEGILSLMQMAKTCAALESLNEAGGFSICIMTHPTTGGVTASFASVTDLVLAEPGALIGFAGPRVIATTLKQELPPGFQRAEFLLEKGMVDMIVDRADARETLARLIDYSTGPRMGEGQSVLTARNRPPLTGG